ncbi:MAG: transcriptional regulator [Ignavibacteria bacterium]|nr:transcriptional regulator [Ignavibacteria bacterium]MBK7252761.1 transcriptional regulator [Ignavibacteria bacterium]MBK7444909.1 transcriptional regulator [Ignavibacteria bacterium]MBK8383554.1 transcriptional regulator [Ignavibacteria bacterium]
MNYDYQQIDDVIHSRIRTTVMAVLVSVEEAEFNYLKEKVNATDGNLSVHLKKLEEAGYVSVKKVFIERKPVSKYKITSKGYKAFENYIKKLENIIKKNV